MDVYPTTQKRTKRSTVVLFVKNVVLESSI